MPRTFQNSKSLSLGLGLTLMNRRVHYNRIKWATIGLSAGMMMKAADTLYLHGQMGLPEYREVITRHESYLDWVEQHPLWATKTSGNLVGVQAHDARGNRIGPVVWMQKPIITLDKIPPQATGILFFDEVRFMNEVPHVLQ